MSLKMKICKLCKEELPLTSYTSTRAHYCNNCRVVRKLTQQREMQQLAFDRLTNKKQKKQVVLSIKQLKSKAQRVFNKWIRNRDKDLPCISCQKWANKFDAGHFWAMGSKSFLRYHEDNCHKQCSFKCNHNLSGNQGEYRIYLIEKIGIGRVDWLEKHRNDTHKFTRTELEEIIEKYKVNS